MPRVRCAFGYVDKLIVRQKVSVTQLIIKPPMLSLPNAHYQFCQQDLTKAVGVTQKPIIRLSVATIFYLIEATPI